jgi:hypothetical protein
MPQQAGESGVGKGSGTGRDRRAAAWPDFLRRILLGASLAGSAAPAGAALPDEPPPGEVAEPERPARQG